MSLKRLLSAGFAVCVLTSSAMAVPTITVTPSATVNAQGNRVWTVQVVPDGGAALPSSLAIELPFTIAAGSATQPMGIINTGGSNTNTGNGSAANDTWYYNETVAGSGTALWNTTSAPEFNINNFVQNVGSNPFCPGAGCPADTNPAVAGHQTEGLFTNGANLFAALGSTIINSGGAINAIQIVTDGGGGILQMGAGVVGQRNPANPTTSLNHTIAAKNFYVPGDFDGNGVVGSQDYDLILFNFGAAAPAAWDGFAPNNPAQVGSVDYDRLLFNFGSGQSFGSGAGGEAVGGNNVPEPATMALAGLSALALLGSIRRRRNVK